MEYKLLKINLEKHPISKEDYDTKLYYFTILHTCLSRDNLLNSSVGNLLMSYKRAFGIKDKEYKIIKYFNTELFYIDESASDLESIIKSLRKEYPNLMRFKINQKGIKYLLIGDLLYLESNLNIYEFIDKSFIKDIIAFLNITDEEFGSILSLFKKLSEKDFIEAKKILFEPKFNSLNYFFEKYKDDFEFDNKDEKTVLVMSTMSSGKSTVINSILGQDLLPSQNEVCTSKLVSITQNVNLDRTIGYARGNRTMIESNLTIDIINDWNSNPYYHEIHVESKSYNKFDYRNKLKFIDTPGTNNSTDKSHYDLTIRTLNKSNFNLILYVLNATNLSCDDDYFILLKVVEYLKNNSDKEILFLLNKMDEIDTEAGESLDSIYTNARDYLKNAGVDSPNIVSMSAYAAKLFRKGLNLETLTRKESADFLNLYDLFSDEGYNLNNYMNLDNKSEIESSEDDEDGYIEIKREKISYKSISQALKNTGVLNLESYLI